jgi:hypothetical protein
LSAEGENAGQLIRFSTKSGHARPPHCHSRALSPKIKPISSPGIKQNLTIIAVVVLLPAVLATAINRRLARRPARNRRAYDWDSVVRRLAFVSSDLRC